MNLLRHQSDTLMFSVAIMVQAPCEVHYLIRRLKVKVFVVAALAAAGLSGCATNVVMNPLQATAAARPSTVLEVRPMGGAYIGVDGTPGVIGIIANVANVVRSVEHAAADRSNFFVSVVFLGRNSYGVETCQLGGVEVGPTDLVGQLAPGDQVAFEKRRDGQKGFDVTRLVTSDGKPQRMDSSDPCWRLRPPSMR